MHRTAHTLVETGLTSKNLRKSTVKNETDSKLLSVVAGTELLGSTKRRTAEEALHNLHKLLIVKLFNTRKSLSENLGVASVRTEGKVVLVEQISLTYASGFLTD